MTLTLRSRLTLVYTAVFGILLISIAFLSYSVLAYQLDLDTTANLTELTSGLHGYLRFGGAAPTIAFDPADPAESAFVEEATQYYQVFDASSGRLIVQSEALRPLGLELTPTEVRQFRDRPVTFDVQTDYGRIRVSNSVLAPDAERSYLLQVGVSLVPMDRVLDRFLVLLLVTVPAALIATFLMGRWMARVALTPLTRLADATRKIDVEDLRRRLPVRGAGDELDDVAVAFNDTLGRLEHTVGEMRQFSTALAHELRTPLTALRGDVEMAMSHPESSHAVRLRFASQLEEIDKLKRLIDQILMFARAEAGEIPLRHDAVDLGTLAASLVDQLEPVAQAKGIQLQCQQSAAVVQGDADWLKRVVLNLLDNAIKFTADGGRIAVSVSHESGMARLAVQDTGIGVEAEAIPYIFERFFRADPARTSEVEGVGLGLSLAKWVVDRHHGRIDVDSQPGRGSTFTVHLPLAHQ